MPSQTFVQYNYFCQNFIHLSDPISILNIRIILSLGRRPEDVTSEAPTEKNYPSIYWQGLGKHLVVNAPSVGILRCSKNPVDARD